MRAKREKKLNIVSSGGVLSNNLVHGVLLIHDHIGSFCNFPLELDKKPYSMMSIMIVNS